MTWGMQEKVNGSLFFHIRTQQFKLYIILWFAYNRQNHISSYATQSWMDHTEQNHGSYIIVSYKWSDGWSRDSWLAINAPVSVVKWSHVCVPACQQSTSSHLSHLLPQLETPMHTHAERKENLWSDVALIPGTACLPAVHNTGLGLSLCF